MTRPRETRKKEGETRKERTERERDRQTERKNESELTNSSLVSDCSAVLSVPQCDISVGSVLSCPHGGNDHTDRSACGKESEDEGRRTCEYQSLRRFDDIETRRSRQIAQKKKGTTVKGKNEKGGAERRKGVAKSRSSCPNTQSSLMDS